MGAKRKALTKEEKKAKKEAKRLKKLLAEIEAKKQARRDELKREMAAQALRRKELDKGWREMMLKIKQPVFKQEVEIMWHTFERVYDKKDHLIHHLQKLIDTADDQFQRTISSFCNTIDNMIERFLSDLETMSKENEKRTATLLKWGWDIYNRLKDDHTAAELHLQLLIFHGHTTCDNYIWNTRGENMVKEDEERAKYLDMRENLRSLLETNYNSMWEEYKNVLKAYVVGTAENQKQVRRLRRKENLMADIIASQAKKIASSDSVLKRLRAELNAYESGSKQAVFRDRRDRHRAAALALKKRLLAGCALDEKRLATLVKCSDEAVDWMLVGHKKGLKMIRLAALCRSYETQREKVLPFGSDIPHNVDDLRASLRRQQDSDKSMVVAAMAATCGLTRLWQRIAKAELGKRALYREKALLERENMELMQQLAEYGVNTDQIVPDAYKCICGDKKKAKDPPVAIDGGIVVKMYEKYY